MKLRLTLLLLCCSCNGKIEDRPQVVAPPPAPTQPLVLRTLLSWQYQRSVADLLGPAAGAAVDPPADVSVNGLEAIGAARLSLSTSSLERYERSAREAASAALTSRDAAGKRAFIGCSSSDPACLGNFVERFGRRAFRRPLTSTERAAYEELGQTAARGYADFNRGVEWVIAAMLQSPHFLYQVELGTRADDRVVLTGYEVASRISFFLLGRGPSDALLDAAAAGGLDTAEGARAQAARLVEQPEARAALAFFFDETFKLRDLEQLPKDVFVFPSFKPSLQRAMRDETQALIADLVWTRDTDWRGLVTADYTFLNDELATHYTLPPVGSTSLVRAALPAGLRAGFLGHASYLSLTAHPIATSPTHRGKFVLDKLLCTPTRPPPPGVSTEFPGQDPNKPPMTAAQRLFEHRNSDACAGCHVAMDGIGVGFENFNAIGQHRDVDPLNQLPVDGTGALDGASFKGPRALGALLVKDSRFAACLSKTLFRVAAGRVEQGEEQALVARLHGAFAAGGFKVKSLLVELASSEAFRAAALPESR